MNDIDFNLWLSNSVTEVLESMCFLFPEVDSDLVADPAPHPEWLSSRLDFAGSPSGSFGLRAPMSSARVIAANFLGEDEADLNDGQAAEVIGEMANMICGSLLGRYEPRRSFNLSSPTWGHDDSPVAVVSNYFCRVFTIDEGVLHAWLEIGPRS